MEEQIMRDSYELKQAVSEWVDKFNFIQVDVLNLVANDCLFEYIRQQEPDFGEFMDNYSLWDEYEIWCKENDSEDIEDSRDEFCKDHSSFESWNDERNNENYPMWNTCFEFKHDESEQVIEAAINAGFGVIEGLGDFNQILFVSGCGYSFYGAHWIPLYLNLPWNKDVKKQVEENNIIYNNL